MNTDFDAAEYARYREHDEYDRGEGRYAHLEAGLARHLIDCDIADSIDAGIFDR